MNDTHASAEPISADPSSDRAERRLRILQELAEIGMDLARAVRTRALAAKDPAAAVDLGLSFSRIARAVRQTLALEARLAEERDARDRRTQAEHARRRGLQRKAVVRHAVEQAIGAETDGTDREDLLDDLHERFEYEDELRFADRPISEHVARICRDLGVTPDRSLWAGEDWAIEEANLLSPTRSERTEGGEMGDAGPSPAAPDPAMTHPPPIWPPSEP
jgi:hypothetical protein